MRSLGFGTITLGGKAGEVGRPRRASGQQEPQRLVAVKDGRAEACPASVVRLCRSATASIGAFGRLHQWAEAAQVLGGARKLGQELDAIVFAAAASALSRASRWESALALLRPGGGAPGSTASMGGAHVSTYERGRQWHHAVAAFDEIRRSRVCAAVFTYNVVISAYGRGKQGIHAAALLREVWAAGLEPDSETLSTSIEAVSRVQLWQSASCLLGQAEELGLELGIKSLDAALGARVAFGLWEAALLLLAALRALRALGPGGLRSDVQIYSSAHGCQPWKRSLSLVSATAASGIEADVVADTAASSACAGGRGWKHALALFSLAPSVRLEPEVRLYGVAMSACDTRWRSALRLLDEVREIGLRPSVISYGTCERAQPWLVALRLVDDATQLSLEANSVMYNSCSNLCEASTQWLPALQLCTAALQAGLEYSLAALSAAAGARARAYVQHWSDALGLLSEAATVLCEPDVRLSGILMGVFEEGKQWRAGVQVLEALARGGVEADASIYSSAIRLQSFQRWPHVLVFLGETVPAVGGVDLISCTAVLSSFEKIRKWEYGISFLLEMTRSSLEPQLNAHSAAVSACEKGHRWEQALSLLDVVQENALEPDVILLRAAIAACEKGHQWTSSLRVLKMMRRQTEAPNVLVCNSFLSSCAKAYQWNSALHSLGDMRMLTVVPDVSSYNVLGSACSSGQQWQRMVGVLQGVSWLGLTADAITYNAALNACAKSGRWVHACVLLGEMTASFELGALAYNGAIGACVKSQERRRALELFMMSASSRADLDSASYVGAVDAAEAEQCLARTLIWLCDLQSDATAATRREGGH